MSSSDEQLTEQDTSHSLRGRVGPTQWVYHLIGEKNLDNFGNK